jgi:hypothetical protein
MASGLPGPIASGLPGHIAHPGIPIAASIPTSSDACWTSAKTFASWALPSSSSNTPWDSSAAGSSFSSPGIGMEIAIRNDIHQADNKQTNQSVVLLLTMKLLLLLTMKLLLLLSPLLLYTDHSQLLLLLLLSVLLVVVYSGGATTTTVVADHTDDDCCLVVVVAVFVAVVVFGTLAAACCGIVGVKFVVVLSQTKHLYQKTMMF